MAIRYLGPQIDIHGGGRDLIFPHHPSEIAQSEAITGAQPFARIWVHTGLVWLDGEKMSKSLGNMIFVRDALRQHSPDTLRWYLLSQPYRDDFFYERGEVGSYSQYVGRVTAALQARSGPEDGLDAAPARAACLAALANDLQTPAALQQIDQLAHAILQASRELRSVESAQASLRELAAIMGFWAAGAERHEVA